MTQLTARTQLTHLRRKLAQVEAAIVEAIAERERLLGELRWASQVATDEAGSAWLAEQGAEAVEEAERILEGVNLE